MFSYMTSDPIANFISARTRKEPHSPVNFWLLIILALGLLAIAVAYFGDSNVVDESSARLGDQTEDKPQSRVYTVTYRFGVFSPTNLRIKVGDTVTFRNTDSGSIRITANPDPQGGRPEFDSVGQVPPNSSFSYTFISEGVFAYHNSANERQAGVIIVRAR